MPMTPTLVLAGIERTLNALLAKDAAASERLAALSGQSLLIRFEQPRLAIALHFHRAGIDLCYATEMPEQDADAVVELTPETVSEWISGASLERLMFSGKLSIRGKVFLLEATRDLLFGLDPDWEGELARLLGDTSARSLADGLRQAARWGMRTRRELMADLGEYVTEEARLLPGRRQKERLREHLTDLEIATDRLEARLKRLHRQVATRCPDQGPATPPPSNSAVAGSGDPRI